MRLTSITWRLPCLGAPIGARITALVLTSATSRHMYRSLFCFGASTSRYHVPLPRTMPWYCLEGQTETRCDRQLQSRVVRSQEAYRRERKRWSVQLRAFALPCFGSRPQSEQVREARTKGQQRGYCIFGLQQRRDVETLPL
jgi:hypothetical protein